MSNRKYLLLALLGVILISISKEFRLVEQITCDSIGFDPYGIDCGKGVIVRIKTTSNDSYKPGLEVFIRPTKPEYEIPIGLIASGDNDLKFYGHFRNDYCTHLMGEGKRKETFFVYDSIEIRCPFKYFNIELMEFESTTCGSHPSFHDRIKIVN